MSTTTTMSTSTTEKKGRNIYYISARKNDEGKVIGWEVKKEKCEKITALCKTKEIALEKVKALAANSGATVIIRKMDGTIQDTLKFASKDEK